MVTTQRRVYLYPLFVIFFTLAALAGPAAAKAQMVADPSVWFEPDGQGDVKVHLYFFWSETCPHCREAHPLIDALSEEYPWLVLHSHELSRNPGAGEMYARMAGSLGQQAQYVPGFLFCGQMITGYDRAETTGAELKQALVQCHDFAQERLVSSAAPVAAAAATGDMTAAGGAAPALALPLLGALNAEALSLPLLTVVIAGMDAFNPCAFFVLMFLLSMMVHARDRKRMFIIGATFVFFSALIYFIFMAAWLNVFMWMGEIKLITLAAGLIAILIAAINIKDYFWFKQGVSLTIPERAKPGLYQRSRNLLKASSMPAMLVGTAVLAVAANSYELLCTAGFPMVYTRILTLESLPTSTFYAYLAAYNLVYVIPLFLIVVGFTITFGARKLSENEGRILKLLSGTMMLFLGALLVAAPERLSELTTAGLLLMAAILLTVVVVAIDRYLHTNRPNSLARRAKPR